MVDDSASWFNGTISQAAAYLSQSFTTGFACARSTPPGIHSKTSTIVPSAALAATTGLSVASLSRRIDHPQRTIMARSLPSPCSIAISASMRETMLSKRSPHSTSTRASGSAAISSIPRVASSRSVSRRYRSR